MERFTSEAILQTVELIPVELRAERLLVEPLQAERRLEESSLHAQLLAAMFRAGAVTEIMKSV
jgi:hypothetical protein